MALAAEASYIRPMQSASITRISQSSNLDTYCPRGCVCSSCIYLSCYMQPEGLWQRLAAAPKDSAPVSPPLEKKTNPVPNDMSVIPGLPLLLPPISAGQRKERQRTDKTQTAGPPPRAPTPPSLPDRAQLPLRSPDRPLPPPPGRSGP